MNKPVLETRDLTPMLGQQNLNPRFCTKKGSPITAQIYLVDNMEIKFFGGDISPITEQIYLVNNVGLEFFVRALRTKKVSPIMSRIHLDEDPGLV